MLVARNNRLLLRPGFGSRDSIEHDPGIRMMLWSWTRAKVKPNVFPGVARSALQTDRCRRFITALDHAIFASRISGDAIHHSVLAPVDVFLQLFKSCIMAIGH